MPAQKSSDPQPFDYLTTDPAWQEYLARAERSQAGKPVGWTESVGPSDEEVREEALAMMRQFPQDAGEILLKYVEFFPPDHFESLAEEFDLTPDQVEALHQAATT